MPYLFVYGTLKTGYHNNSYLYDQKFIREAQTQPLYRLFDNGRYPMMIRSRDGYAVSGEIWRVKLDALEEIDYHEAHYTRRRVKVQGFRKPIYAYIYNYKVKASEECYGYWG